mgnify:CR=1 FL=1
MNKGKRLAIRKVLNKLDDLLAVLDELRNEERECLENIPENLQGSTRYEESERAADSLDSAYDSIEEVIGSLEDAMLETY